MPSDALPNDRFDGRFSDGRSAASSEVRVRFTDRGLAIERAGQSEPLIWPYGALHTSEPLSPHAVDAAVTYTHQAGATLFVPNASFARGLAVAAPHLTTRAQRWRHARPWIAAAAVIVLVGALIWAGGLSPATSIARALPDKVRHAMGGHVVASMSKGHEKCTDVAGRAALDKLSQRLANASGSDKTFQIVVVDWKLLNAFATPGERVVVTSKLIAKAGSADELAGVLAHEMGHGIHLHPETGLVRAIGLTAAVELMVGGGGGTLAGLGTALAQLSYSRAAEREADEEAVRILRNAKISTKGLEDFFKRISIRARKKDADAAPGDPPKDKTSTSGWGNPFDLLRSHPPTKARMEQLRNQPHYESTPALTPLDWQALKGICKSTVADKE